MTIRADNRLADAPMRTVECRRCAAEVLVRKASQSQTSVQWNANATSSCAERRELAALAGDGGEPFFLGCAALSESIVDAVRGGELTVVDEAVGVTA
jgi:hypothetical protein